jgi:sporulation protein YabP
MAHRLELEGREKLVVSGVEEVERFDEEEIVMRTTAGNLVVGGEGLHIGKLNLEGGQLHVDGSIHTLLYEDPSPARSGGFLRRLLG